MIVWYSEWFNKICTFHRWDPGNINTRSESTQTDSMASGFSLEFCSAQLDSSQGPPSNVNQLKIKTVRHSIKHLFPFSSIPVLVLTARHTASLFCLFSFRVWLHKLRYNSNQYFQAKRSLLHMDIMVIR